MKKLLTFTLTLIAALAFSQESVFGQNAQEGVNPATAVWGTRVPQSPMSPDMISQWGVDGTGNGGQQPRRHAASNSNANGNGNSSGNGLQMVDVIIQFKNNASILAKTMAFLGQGGKVKKDISSIIHGNSFTVPSVLIPILAKDPDILYITPERTLNRADYTGDIVTNTLSANIAWTAGFDGRGVGVAVIDSGIYNHPDLNNSTQTASRVVYSQDFTGLGIADQYGHGTHVAGIVAGNGFSSTGGNNRVTFHGMAPQANIINLRVLDANGASNDTTVIAAIQQAILLKNVYNIRVINLSMGRKVYESYTLDPLDQAVEAAWKAGIVVVTAAGNYGRDNTLKTHGYGMIISPGNDPYVITVGAMKELGTASPWDDQIASYSSKGPTLFDHVIKPDIVAPGNQIASLLAPNSTIATKYPTLVVPPGAYNNQPLGVTPKYLRLSGTSMAAPMVSGAAALLIQKDPTLTPDQIKALLMRTADKFTITNDTYWDAPSGITFFHQYDIFTVGAGYLDVVNAINSTYRAKAGYALSPIAVFHGASAINLVFDSSVFGSQAVVWGTDDFSVVWGTSVVNASTVIWGTSVIWATDSDMGDLSVVWGTGTIWATDDDFSVVWGTESDVSDPEG